MVSSVPRSMSGEWATLTEIGRSLGVGARMLGRHLGARGLRDPVTGQPTLEAVKEGWAIATAISPRNAVRRSAAFFLWSVVKVGSMLERPSPPLPAGGSEGVPGGVTRPLAPRRVPERYRRLNPALADVLDAWEEIGAAQGGSLTEEQKAARMAELLPLCDERLRAGLLLGRIPPRQG